jgi:hypothetical protein
MSRIPKVVWFAALYVASVAAFALATLSIRALLQVAQRLAQT